MRVVANLLELCGFAAVAGGLYLLAPWAGVVAGGVALVAVATYLNSRGDE